MEKLYENAGFILAFLISILVAQTFLGKKMVTWGLLLILLSQMVLNPELIQSLKLGKSSEKEIVKTSYKGVTYL